MTVHVLYQLNLSYLIQLVKHTYLSDLLGLFSLEMIKMHDNGAQT